MSASAFLAGNATLAHSVHNHSQMPSSKEKSTRLWSSRCHTSHWVEYLTRSKFSLFASCLLGMWAENAWPSSAACVRSPKQHSKRQCALPWRLGFGADASFSFACAFHPLDPVCTSKEICLHSRAQPRAREIQLIARQRYALRVDCKQNEANYRITEK